jgi:putative ABC transport system ATP-binding protein
MRPDLGKQNEHHVLWDIDPEIERGESISVIGFSGSGRSTLLHNISGMDRRPPRAPFLTERSYPVSREGVLSDLRPIAMGFSVQHIHLLH